MQGARAESQILRCYPVLSAMPAHSHDEPRLCFVLRGEFEEMIGGSRHLRRRGMVLFRPAGSLHSERFGRDGATCAVLKPPPDWLVLAREFGARLEDMMDAKGMAVLRLADLIEGECNFADPVSKLNLQCALWETAALFADARPMTAESALAKRALDLLYAHDDGPLGLSQVARALDVHRGHLARSFRATYGVTLGARLRGIRIQRAAALIRGTSIPLIDVAQRCGFASQAHMTRLFQASLGVTPGRYRRHTR